MWGEWSYKLSIGKDISVGIEMNKGHLGQVG